MPFYRRGAIMVVGGAIMTTYEQVYLVLVVAAFLSFIVTLGTISWLNRQ